MFHRKVEVHLPAVVDTPHFQSAVGLSLGWSTIRRAYGYMVANEVIERVAWLWSDMDRIERLSYVKAFLADRAAARAKAMEILISWKDKVATGDVSHPAVLSLVIEPNGDCWNKRLEYIPNYWATNDHFLSEDGHRDAWVSIPMEKW